MNAFLKLILLLSLSLNGYFICGDILNINAFKNNPTYKSSLKFLRKTPWARAKVEKLYLKTMID